ncbi:hypothetical protein STRZYGA_00010 [Brevundimonas phage vB_BpoS-Strzyga]|nr:hypothetical protein STRZYGA_00010 [Brevundimonas phage vB_BpoS-Strzyga]
MQTFVLRGDRIELGQLLGRFLGVFVFDAQVLQDAIDRLQLFLVGLAVARSCLGELDDFRLHHLGNGGVLDQLRHGRDDRVNVKTAALHFHDHLAHFFLRHRHQRGAQLDGTVGQHFRHGRLIAFGLPLVAGRRADVAERLHQLGEATDGVEPLGHTVLIKDAVRLGQKAVPLHDFFAGRQDQGDLGVHLGGVGAVNLGAQAVESLGQGIGRGYGCLVSGGIRLFLEGPAVGGLPDLFDLVASRFRSVGIVVPFFLVGFRRLLVVLVIRVVLIGVIVFLGLLVVSGLIRRGLVGVVVRLLLVILFGVSLDQVLASFLEEVHPRVIAGGLGQNSGLGGDLLIGRLPQLEGDFFLGAVGLQQREGGGGHTGVVDQGDFDGFSDEALLAVSFPALGVTPADGEARVAARHHHRPLGVIDHLGAGFDGLFFIVEDQLLVQNAGDLVGMHDTDIAEGLALGRCRNAVGPFLEQRLGAFVVHDLARLVEHFFRDDSVDEALFLVHLPDGKEQPGLAHRLVSLTGLGGGVTL